MNSSVGADMQSSARFSPRDLFKFEASSELAQTQVSAKRKAKESYLLKKWAPWMGGFKVFLPCFLIKDSKEVEDKLVYGELDKLPYTWGIKNEEHLADITYIQVHLQIQADDNQLTLYSQDRFAIQKQQALLLYLPEMGDVKVVLSHTRSQDLQLSQDKESTPCAVKIQMRDSSSSTGIPILFQDRFLDIFIRKSDQMIVKKVHKPKCYRYPSLQDENEFSVISKAVYQVEAEAKDQVQRDARLELLASVLNEEESKSVHQAQEEESKTSLANQDRRRFNLFPIDSPRSSVKYPAEKSTEIRRVESSSSSTKSNYQSVQSQSKYFQMKGCQCKVVRCITMQCGCMKRGNKCGPLCRCQSCLNNN